MPSEGEHGQGDQRIWSGEAESDAREESDLCVHGFDEPVGQAVFNGSEYLCTVAGDASLEVDERIDTASSCPLNPTIECFGGLVDGELEDSAEPFFEQVRAIKTWIGGWMRSSGASRVGDQ